MEDGKDYDTSDRSPRHTGDRLLRDYGFTIHSRPRMGQTLWTRAGNIYTQAEAERIIRHAHRRTL